MIFIFDSWLERDYIMFLCPLRNPVFAAVNHSDWIAEIFIAALTAQSSLDRMPDNIV